MPRKKHAGLGRRQGQAEQAAHGSPEVPTAFRLLDHSALPLLLQHTNLLDQQTISRLLCVSKGMAAGVLQHCTGLLTASVGLPISSPGEEKGTALKQAWQEVQQFAGWLSRNATLMQHFQNQGIGLEGKHAEAAEAAIADALRAAAAKAPLQIESYTAERASASTHVILQQFPAAKLTRLELVFSAEAEKATLPRGFSRVLGALTRLKCLRLECGGDSIIAPGISELRQLTYMEVRPVANMTKLRYAPPQLQELVFSAEKPRNFLQLSHATALTRLAAINCYGWHGVYTITDKDQLPASLVELDVGDAESAWPLMHLQQLQKLALYDTVLPAEQLKQLSSSLTSLQDVRLQYVNRFNSQGSLIQAPESAADGWAGLPVKTLVIRSREDEAGFHLSRQLIQGLSALTGLARLEIAEPGVFKAGAQQLGAVLASLTTLQKLSLGGGDMLDSIVYQNAGGEDVIGFDAGLEIRAVKMVLDSCVGLSGLRHLSITHWDLFWSREVTSASLKRATQLTALELEECDLDDACAITLASSLTELRLLNLFGNDCITDHFLKQISTQLRNLQELCIFGTEVTDQAAEEFSSRREGLTVLNDAHGWRMHHYGAEMD